MLNKVLIKSTENCFFNLLSGKRLIDPQNTTRVSLKVVTPGDWEHTGWHRRFPEGSMLCLEGVCSGCKKPLKCSFEENFSAVQLSEQRNSLSTMLTSRCALFLRCSYAFECSLWSFVPKLGPLFPLKRLLTLAWP